MCRECARHPEPAVECRRLRAETLRRVYLFEGLPSAALERVLDGSSEIQLEAEQWLFLRDDPARHFYLVIEGDLALVRHSAAGDELIVAIVGPGELFEEDLALVDGARHSVAARPLGRCRLVRFDLCRVRRVLTDTPEIVVELARTMHRRNTLLLDELERVSIQDAGQRLISFLEGQTTAAGEQLPLRFPKRVLASRLSIRPETLSRVLARLKDCDRVREVDGALVLLPAGDEPYAACAACPARLWGCPGPRRAGDRLPATGGPAPARPSPRHTAAASSRRRTVT